MIKSILSVGLLLTFVVATGYSNPQPSSERNFEVLSASVNSFCKLIQLGDYDAVKSLIEKGEDVNAKSTGLTPLMFAARHNRPEIAQLLIDNGAKLNSRSEKDGMTALQLAEKYKASETYEVIKVASDSKKKSKKK